MCRCECELVCLSGPVINWWLVQGEARLRPVIRSSLPVTLSAGSMGIWNGCVYNCLCLSTNIFFSNSTICLYVITGCSSVAFDCPQVTRRYSWHGCCSRAGYAQVSTDSRVHTPVCECEFAQRGLEYQSLIRWAYGAIYRWSMEQKHSDSALRLLNYSCRTFNMMETESVNSPLKLAWLAFTQFFYWPE